MSVLLNQFDGLNLRTPLPSYWGQSSFPLVYGNSGLRGIGDFQDITPGAQQVVSGSIGASTASNPTSIVQSAGAIAAGTLSTASAMGAAWATAAIPIVGPIIAGITIGLSLLFGRKGPKQKVATTAIVNDVEPKLKQNVDAYLAGPRYYSAQQQAIANFYAGWNYVLQHCGDPSMGDPGQRCISERQEGAHPQWDACRNSPGGCPNWFQLYLDPIRNDPNVQPDPTVLDTAASTIDQAVSGAVGGIPTPLLLAGGLLLVAVFMGGKSK